MCEVDVNLDLGRDVPDPAPLQADATRHVGASPVAAPEPEADYRGLFDHGVTPLSLVSARDGLQVVAASRGFLNSFDFRRHATVGRSLEALFTAESYANLKTAVERCLATSESFHVVAERRNDASRHSVRLAVHPTRARGFAGHVILQAETTTHSVHARVLAPPTLFDDVTGQSMTYVFDARRRRLRYTNGLLSRRLGMAGGVLTAAAFKAMIHPDDLSAFQAYEATRDALADEEFLSTTLRLRDAEGEWRTISIRARVLRRDATGAPRMMLGNAIDVTDYANAAAQAASISVRHAEENERARIGRELHDSTSQHLVGASLGLASVLRGDGLSATVRAQLTDIQRSLATAQTEIRAFAYFLHPPELRELGLRKTAERFCEGFARRSGLAIAFRSSDLPDDLSSDAEHALFRVCQEALMNVYRHAFARNVTVDLRLKDGRIVLEVRDDGVGVDGVDRFEHGGLGVAGMRARMRSVRGDLILDYLGSGLGVVASAPYPARR